jgi:hypothetical protein
MSVRLVKARLVMDTGHSLTRIQFSWFGIDDVLRAAVHFAVNVSLAREHPEAGAPHPRPAASNKFTFCSKQQADSCVAFMPILAAPARPNCNLSHCSPSRAVAPSWRSN